jgi:hypothetical protein
MPKHIANEWLRAEKIPASDAPWSEIERFARTFDGYALFTDSDSLAHAVQRSYGATMTELRIALFFEQRKWKNEGTAPDEESLHRIRGLLEQIRVRVRLANDLLR